MAKLPQNQSGSKSTTPSSDQLIDRAERAATKAEELISGGIDLELEDRKHLDSIVRTIARQVNAKQVRLTGGNSLETMARLKQDSLLGTPIVSDNQFSKSDVGKSGATLKDALDKVESSMISELFATEKARLDDYQIFSQINELITQASEAIQTYCDNIISPDDFTKRDINVFYEGLDEDSELQTTIRTNVKALIEKYRLDDRAEDAILKSLVKGDFFIAILNLRQELEQVLNETPFEQTNLIESNHIPPLNDPDLNALISIIKEETSKEDIDVSDFRHDFAQYLNEFVTINEDTSKLVQSTTMSMEFAKDIPSVNGFQKNQQERKKQKLDNTKIKGSIVKMIPPENVIKLNQDDVLFGYYYIEIVGPDYSDSLRRNTIDQTTVVSAINQNLSSRTNFENGSHQSNLKGKDALISRIIIKTLSAKLGNVKFLNDNEEFAADAYVILARAKREKKRVTFTYIAADQMVHFTPNGSIGYGESVLIRVKFLSKLYIGAITNAFMRNSIRRPERLVWYIDVGVDNDGNNAVQNFIRTIKQREVKFSNLRDITTTINQIGEFHDFYVPTYNGERPVEVETLNMGAAAEVDSPFLEYLRKAIIGGMGVPAAFLGYSEEIAFARSLTMDNGRFLRRVIRHQKHYGKAMSKLIQIIWRNEYYDLDKILGREVKEDDDAKKLKKPKKTKDGEESNEKEYKLEIEIDKIIVRYPSPATLNMTNLADAINQGQPVADFVTETLAGAEEDPVKAELKKQVIRDIIPQISWDKYDEFLVNAKKEGDKKKAITATMDTSGGSTDTSMDAGMGGEEETNKTTPEEEDIKM
jgi:hypothetical protein